MTVEEKILDEATDNLLEALQRIKATRNRLWSTSMEDHPNYRDLSYRVSMVLAMAEAAYLEVSRKSERGSDR